MAQDEIGLRDMQRGYTEMEAYKHFNKYPVRSWEMSHEEIRKDYDLVKARMDFYSRRDFDFRLGIFMLMFVVGYVGYMFGGGLN